ncbi:MAG: acyl-CoA dehydrogenase family protein [Sphingomonas paucimobilis]
MNFTLSDDQRMLVDTLDRFLGDRYSIELRRKVATTAPGHDPAIWTTLAELGAIGALFTEEQGGFGGDPFDVTAVFEAAGRALLAEPLLPALLAGRVLAAAASPQLELAIAGSAILAFAHDEPGEPDGEAPRVTRLRRADGDDGWVLHGRKTLVHAAEAATSIVVSATGADGRTALLLVPADAPNLFLQGYATHDGLRAADVVLEGVPLDDVALLLAGDAAEAVLAHALHIGTLAICAEALGIMETLIAMTRDYLATRQQFGAPIGRNQALQHRMADLLIEAQQARSAVIIAAAALTDGQDPARAVAAAKYTIGTAGESIGEEAIQMHGGIGMTEELALSHYAKRLILIDQQLGDADLHLTRYIRARPVAA